MYLPQVETPVELSARVALVGVDGWADGGYGNWIKSTVWLSDYELIKDLVPYAATRPNLRAKLREIAAAEAARIRLKLEAALPAFSTVIVATHVPPFAEAAWHEGKQSEWDYLPHFASRFVGDTIRELVVQHSHQRTLVLCGHTHGSGECQPEYGLHVWTGKAVYRQPSIAAVLEVTDDRITSSDPAFTSF
jgi:hypothetical protein